MKRLGRYLRRHWLSYGFGILCTVATTTAQNFIPLLVRNAINAIQKGHGESLARCAELVVILAIITGVTRWFSRFVMFNTARDVEYELRNDLFAHLTRLGSGFYQRVKTGDLMSRMVNDLTAIRMLIGMGILTFTNAPLAYIYALGFMITLSPRLAVAVIVPAALLLVGMRLLTRALMERSLRVQEGLGAMGAKVQESLAGIHVIKAYTVEDHDATRFRELNEDYNQQGLALARLRGAMFPMIRSAVASSTMIILIYGGSLVIRHRMSVGDLVAFMSYVAYLAWPTTALGWMLSIYQRGKAAMKRLNEILETPPSEPGEGIARQLEVAGSIEWDNVSFSYFEGNGHGERTAPHALRNINVRIPAGAKLAIVGRTGSGKSTMIKLLARLIEPTQGRVLLDGKDLRTVPLAAVRRTIGLVPQESTLFSDSLSRNIGFGRPDAGPSEIQRCADVAGLTPDIAILPHGLETLVGERGMALSGGQKQRVTIARLLAYDPRVVVLDDALSSVDTETERSILKSLEESVHDRTTIVVAHRASTVRDADEIVVLDEGAIVERGTHEQLMGRRGLYAELFHRQLLEEELERY